MAAEMTVGGELVAAVTVAQVLVLLASIAGTALAVSEAGVHLVVEELGREAGRGRCRRFEVLQTRYRGSTVGGGSVTTGRSRDGEGPMGEDLRPSPAGGGCGGGVDVDDLPRGRGHGLVVGEAHVVDPGKRRRGPQAVLAAEDRGVHNDATGKLEGVAANPLLDNSPCAAVGEAVAGEGDRAGHEAERRLHPTLAGASIVTRLRGASHDPTDRDVSSPPCDGSQSRRDNGATIPGPLMQTASDCSVCAVALVSGEERFIEEWIAYHRLIGVDHFILYDNNPRLPLRALLAVRELRDRDRLAGRSDRQVARSESSAQDVRTCTRAAWPRLEWVTFIDIDEFIVLRGTATCGAFLSRLGDFGSVRLNWHVFGHNGITRTRWTRSVVADADG